MPIGIPSFRRDNGKTFLHTLGLGSNSTYLNTLYSSGQISSRVWSLFWGRIEKITGQNYTQPLDLSPSTGCWTGVTVPITNLVVNFRDGSDHPILPQGSTINCGIVPQREMLMEAPLFIVDAFDDLSRLDFLGQSLEYHWLSRVYNSSKDSGADITFPLGNFLQVRELLIRPTGQLPTLGRYFLTGAYLMFNHDAEEFTLWQANPSERTSLTPVVRSGECKPESGPDEPGSNGTETWAPLAVTTRRER
ncbi:hypothetical protein B0H67DRAFT_680020 [Lasiosphaeris hirsuta]|uniref:Uncharacterized protein n=1 Tax=Lasiosphaeris hirsuta TaxID=260670 RepID=A0AA40AYQ8_9PEZI|nr:hypothetical protein B0H67DRAFT_680020 [Lasiosphaeris hirsuta]